MVSTSRDVAKRLLHAASPRLAARLSASRGRALSHRLVKQWGVDELNRKLVDHFGLQVQEGPFAGLRLTPVCEAEHLGPFLLGVYESEIDAAWRVVLDGSYRQVVDVGAKFGYYAVGLARAFPSAEVVAFDTDPWAQRAVRDVARANGVGNVRVHGFCEAGWFNDSLLDASLIVSDCEGYEATLFEAITTPSLRTSTILVETHDGFVEGATARVVAALKGTHVIRTFGTDSPRRQSTLSLAFLTDTDRQVAQHEVRGDQAWLLCLPTSGVNQSLALP